MRVPLSWLLAHVDVGAVDARDIADRLTDAGLKVERVEETGVGISNVVVAQVLDLEDLTGFKKPVRWVTLSDGAEQRQVICGATNFSVGDVVAYARPPALLPGGFEISRRKAYGHESDGMICSARELALGDDHTGILVLGRGPDGLRLGADVVEALHLRDSVLDIDVSPDRGYAMSIRGVAREVATAFGLDFRDPAAAADVPGADDGAVSGYPVVIEDPAGCDRYVARIATGVDAAVASPAWLQRRLTLAGMRPISLAVDVTNHVMLELGQPLHAFDRATLSGAIVVRRALPGERLRTLDDSERTLDPADLVIADDSGAVALAGVMGGAATEISRATTEVLLEAAHFDPVSVAYTARRHRLPSEASRRFERGVDDAIAAAAAQRAVEMLVDLGAGTAAPGATDVDVRSARPVIRLAAGRPGELAGVDYDAAAVRRRLEQVGCSVAGTDPLEVTPPSWRSDLRLDVDLVEEVVRLEGYDRLPSTVPAAPAGGGLSRSQRQRRQVGRALAGAGFVEILTYPFIDAGAGDRLLLDAGDARRPSVRLVNPVSEQEPFLRATLLPGLLAALGRNIGRGFPDVALFELGSVFRRPAQAGAMPRPPVARRPSADVLAAIDAALPEQPLHVAVVAAGRFDPSGWWGGGRDVGWADAVEAARTVGAAVGADLAVTADTMAPWHPGRCAALRVGPETVGHAGELHPRVVEALGLPAGAVAMELHLTPVLDAAVDVPAAPLISAYPPATVDVALVVAETVPAADVEAAVRAGAGPLLESIRLFDRYVGDQVGVERKSLAYSLRFRAADRTLTADEVTAARDAAIAEAAARCGATLRT